MKHVLFVAYHMPPAGGIPVRRALRFLRHLPDQGWRCSLLTAERPFDPYHPADPEGVRTLSGLRLSALVRSPARSTAERAAAGLLTSFRALQPSRSRAEGNPDGGMSRLRRGVGETVFFPDPKTGWAKHALPRGRALFQSDPFDLIFATAYPWSALALADRLSAALQRPWLADFRDAWVDNPRGHWGGPRHRSLERALLGRAAHIVTATSGIEAGLTARYGECLAGKLSTIRTGYDASEVLPEESSLPDPSRLRITYTGTFNDALPPSSVDQSPYALLRAVEALPQAVREKLSIHLVGRLGAAYRDWIERDLRDVVRVEGPVTHTEALSAQRRADLLLVVVGSDPSNASVLTGKFVEYLGAQRPIWALAPAGELRDEVEKVEGFWDAADDVAAICARLESLVSLWDEGKLPVCTEAAEWSAEVAARKLAARFDSLVD